MSLSIYNIKKWIKMFCGKSILHVDQGVGKVYSLTEIKGYYNDLTNKVLKDREKDELKIPTFEAPNGETVLFPITIFQYGLGAYDLYLLEKKELYFEKFKQCAEWALNNQQANGAWNAFFFIYPDAPYSSMAQGEGASLLLRAFKEFNSEEYLLAAKQAIDYMIKPIDQGGTALYVDDEIYFLEYTNKPVVLNGWIFSLFGLYDYFKVTDDDNVREIFNISTRTLVKKIADFDNGFWSMYDIDCKITSSFYHKLHIAQLFALNEMTGNRVFVDYHTKWLKYMERPTNRIRVILIKALQKVREK